MFVPFVYTKTKCGEKEEKQKHSCEIKNSIFFFTFSQRICLWVVLRSFVVYVYFSVAIGVFGITIYDKIDKIRIIWIGIFGWQNVHNLLTFPIWIAQKNYYLKKTVEIRNTQRIRQIKWHKHSHIVRMERYCCIKKHWSFLFYSAWNHWQNLHHTN